MRRVALCGTETLHRKKSSTHKRGERRREEGGFGFFFLLVAGAFLQLPARDGREGERGRERRKERGTILQGRKQREREREKDLLLFTEEEGKGERERERLGLGRTTGAGRQNCVMRPSIGRSDELGKTEANGRRPYIHERSYQSTLVAATPGIAEMRKARRIITAQRRGGVAHF